MVFLLGSHAAGKTTFLKKVRRHLGCTVVFGDGFTPTEVEKVRLIEEWYASIDGYVVEGQRFYRGRVYDAIGDAVEKHQDVKTLIIFAHVTPDTMLKRVAARVGHKPSAYLTEKAEYEAVTRFERKLLALRTRLKHRPNFEVKDVSVDRFSAWMTTVLYMIPYYPKF